MTCLSRILKADHFASIFYPHREKKKSNRSRHTLKNLRTHYWTRGRLVKIFLNENVLFKNVNFCLITNIKSQWRSSAARAEDQESKLKLIEIESRRLKNLEAMVGKITPEVSVEESRKQASEQAQQTMYEEFREQMEQERQLEAAQRHQSKELVQKMKNAKGLEEKLDTIISVIADNSGKCTLSRKRYNSIDEHSY